jgi:tetratricopeptide (TPR) repeat protein
VTYASLLQERRRALHARIVEAIERLYPERLAEQIEPLAHHSLRGEVWDKAVGYLRDAAARASSRCAYRDAVGHCERALDALGHLPENRRHIELAIDLRFELRNALLPLGERARIPDYLRDAEVLAGVIDDQSRLGRVYAYMAHYQSLLGEQDEAIKAGGRSLAIAADLGDIDLEVLATFYLGQTYHSLGRYRRAAELLRRNVTTLSGNLAHARFGLPGPLSAFSRTWLGLCLAELGEFDDGAAVIEESMRIAETVNLLYSLIQALYGTGLLYLRKGEPQAAATALHRGLELTRLWHIPIWDPLFASALGNAHVLSGRAAEGLPLLTQALEQASAMKMVTGHSALVARLGDGYLLADRLPEALSLAARALELARAHHERALEAEAQRLFGDAAFRANGGSPSPAEAHYRTALGLAEELGLRPLAAQCHLGLGRFYRREGNRDAAEQHLATAASLFEVMRMTLWRHVTSREIEEARSPEPHMVIGTFPTRTTEFSR